MAKNKKKRKKRPGGPPRSGSAPKRPQAAAAPAEATAEARRTAEERQQAAVRRRQAERRRQRTRRIALAVVIVLAIAGIFVGRAWQNRRALAQYERLSSAAGCGPVRTIRGLSREHVSQGQPLPTYDTSPPVGGAHAPGTLPAGVYQEPLTRDIQQGSSIYHAVHSLEHGYIGVWHDGLEEDELSAIERGLRGEPKVFVVPYPDLEEEHKMALTAWGRLQYCSGADADVVAAFVRQFREKTAPESSQP